jgi:hypothetical protein
LPKFCRLTGFKFCHFNAAVRTLRHHPPSGSFNRSLSRNPSLGVAASPAPAADVMRWQGQGDAIVLAVIARLATACLHYTWALCARHSLFCKASSSSCEQLHWAVIKYAILNAARILTAHNPEVTGLTPTRPRLEHE